MQYADAHAFASGDADYASLEILNELKHCYILVLERVAIEKAIGAKIETQEEYETLSTMAPSQGNSSSTVGKAKW